MALFESGADFNRRQELQDYMFATPLGRFWINYWRRRLGELPLKTKEARAELAMRERRLSELLRGEP